MKRIVFALSLLAVVAVVSACAAKGYRNQARVGAKTIGETVLALDDAEWQANASKAYSADVHAKLGDAITKLLYAGRAYERGVRAIPVNGTAIPQALTDAEKQLDAALADIGQLVPQAGSARAPLTTALEAVKAAYAVIKAKQLPPVQGAEIPAGVLQLFALANLMANLVASGRTTFEKLKGDLQSSGATDEELDALDASYTSAIARREADKATDPTV